MKLWSSQRCQSSGIEAFSKEDHNTEEDIHAGQDNRVVNIHVKSIRICLWRRWTSLTGDQQQMPQKTAYHAMLPQALCESDLPCHWFIQVAIAASCSQRCKVKTRVGLLQEYLGGIVAAI